MSRENDGLPMLPPWLSESDVTDTGYEAPVQNLPQDEVIPEKKKGGRRLFGTRNPRKGPVPDPITPPAAPDPDPSPSPESPQWTPPRQGTPIPQRDPGTHFTLPTNGRPAQPTNGQSSASGQANYPAQPNNQGFTPGHPNDQALAPGDQGPASTPPNQGPASSQSGGQPFQPDHQNSAPGHPGGQTFSPGQPNGQGFTPAHPDGPAQPGVQGPAPAQASGPGFTAAPPEGSAQPEGHGGQPFSGQSPVPPQGVGPRFDQPPTTGGQFSQAPVEPEAARQSQHSGGEGAAASPFTVPPTPAVPGQAADQSGHVRPQHSRPGFAQPTIPPSPDAPRHGSAEAEIRSAGASLAGAPTPVAPADPTTHMPLPPSPSESDSATADPALRAARPPLPPSPAELDAAAQTSTAAGDSAAATTKISNPLLPPAPGELDATGSGIISPVDPARREPIPSSPTPPSEATPVPNTTAAAHELLDAELAGLGGALTGPNPQSLNAEADSADAPRGEHPDEDGDFDQPMTPGRHRAADVPLPLPSDIHPGGPAPTTPVGSGPIPQVPGPQGSGPQAPGPWVPPAPPVPGVPGWSTAPDAQVPPVGSDPRQPAGAVPPQLNPWAQPAASADTTDADANPWANAPMSEAAAAGLTARHASAPPQGQNGIPGQPQTPNAQPHWGPRSPEFGGQAPATGAPGQMPWGPSNQQVPPAGQGQWAAPGQEQAAYPGGPATPAPGQPGIGGPTPWNTGGQPLVGMPGQDGPGAGQQAPGAGSGQEQAPAYPDGQSPQVVGDAGQPGSGMPGYGSGGANQSPWAAPGSEQPGGYPGGPVQGSNGPLSPGQAFGLQGQPGEAGPYGAAPGQYGAPTGQYGAPTGQYGAPAGQYGQAGYGGPGQQWGANGPGVSGPSLDDVQVRRAKKAPGSGWRKAVHHLSGGSINPGMSAEERRLQELVARIRQPVRGDYRIAVLSLKGGVGKTTTTMGLGSIFASIRGDRVIAVDANPDFGTLSQRVPLQTRSTVRDLLLDEHIQRYSDVRRHTSQGSSRLEVLASERDPAASEAFSEEEYRAVARILQRFYNIILTDCGTGLMHSAMAGVLDLAHSLVLISSSAIDGARSAAATLDWLSLHGHDHLVRNAVVVINLPRPGAPNVGINQLRDYFLSRCRAVHIIPYDPHLGEGAEIDLHRLSKPTKRAYVELAATVADDFTADPRRYRG
ncbi:AAA family ATPase [Nocardia sp. CDC153]|uniref:nucleotide-binding protein n=1 Tax=Nocardia sp. CDC153 TaxID=3112167 RepID=UPI002DBA0488|nr:AAA family ATPase [Nocardia sp. CDC153]MEC3954987.1 AAA family ATPase [Nocardia sp. CDC153]